MTFKLCPPFDLAAKMQFCFFGKSAYEPDFLICKMGIRKCGLFLKEYVRWNEIVHIKKALKTVGLKAA